MIYLKRGKKLKIIKETINKVNFFKKNLQQVIVLLFKISHKHFLWFFLLNLLLGLIPSITLLSGKYLIDNIVSTINGIMLKSKIIIWLLINLLIEVFYHLLVELSTYCQSDYSSLINQYITEALIEKAKNLPMNSFDNSQTYNDIQKIYKESTPRAMSILSTMITFCEKGINLLCLSFTISSMNLSLIILYLCSIIPMFLLNIKMFKKWFFLFEQRCEKLRFVDTLKNILLPNENIKEIKLYNVWHLFKEKITSIYSGYRHEDRMVRKTFLIKSTLIRIIEQFISFIIKIKIVFISLTCNFSLGTLNMCLLSLDNIKTSVMNILDSISSFSENNLYMQSLFNVLKLPETDRKEQMAFDGKFKKIEFKNVYFGYSKSDKFILKDINFTIYSGKSYAIFGPNGSGKTTLIKLLLGLYKPSSGHIFIDDIDMENYTSESLLDNMSCVFQDFIKYPLTIGENISLNSNFETQMLKIKKAALLSESAEFIEQLPQQYNTQLQKEWANGTNLSLGQWQKLAIARAFMKNSSIFIFDEPTASLDIKSEQNIISRIVSMQKTIILISHKPQLIKKADTILYIENGRLTSINNIKSD